MLVSQASGRSSPAGWNRRRASRFASAPPCFRRGAAAHKGPWRHPKLISSAPEPLLLNGRGIRYMHLELAISKRRKWILKFCHIPRVLQRWRNSLRSCHCNNLNRWSFLNFQAYTRINYYVIPCKKEHSVICTSLWRSSIGGWSAWRPLGGWDRCYFAFDRQIQWLPLFHYAH